jgi:hypothetical protein
MKKQIFFLMLLLNFLYAVSLTAQNVAINNNSSSPDPSAMLDVSATDKGVLIPRMTQAQRNAITNPATGLIIFQTDNTPGLYYNSGTPATPAWATVGSNAAQWLTNGSSLYYNSGNVGIGTSTPTAKFQVTGGDVLLNGITVGKGAGSIATNSAFGYQALYSNTIGLRNTAYGYQALYSNTTGTYNTAVGYMSQNQSVTGTRNTSVGYQALRYSTGSYNTAIGSEALIDNSSGSFNTAIGAGASYSNETGKYNVAIGRAALGENLTGNSNVAIGIMALSSMYDRSNLVAIGDSALMNNGINATDTNHSVRNVAVGSKALYANTTGRDNMAIGFQALYSNTTGYQNVALGSRTLYSNSTGLFNTAIGNFALNANSAGSRNTATGYTALAFNTGGEYNTASGFSALVANSTGNMNTAIGSKALFLNTTGNSNVALGYYAGFYETSGNRLYIDNQSRGNLENGRQKSMIYGIFDTDPLKQKLTFNASVGIGTTDPDSTALLDMTSTTKGVLIPRLSTTERNAITLPAEGLMVFCTDCGVEGSLSVFSNGTWKTFLTCSSPSIPVAQTNIVTQGQIVWHWHTEGDLIGCKWNNINNYSSATDMGTVTSMTQTGIICDTIYSAFVWAYNSCSSSPVLQMTVIVPANAPVTPTSVTHVGFETCISWRWNPVSSATGYKWNSINDFASATDMGTSTNKSQCSLTCETSYTSYAWAYNGCGYSSPVTLTQSTDICCSNSFIINHVAGNVAPDTKTVTYGTVDGIPGEPYICWITSNLGSDHQATAVDDATEASAGWYWQFNREQGYKHDGTTLTPSSWSYGLDELYDWQTFNDPCRIVFGGNWRLPSQTEWINIDMTGGWTDWNGPWNSALKLHAAGYLNDYNGTLIGRGSTGYYWSSKSYGNEEGYHLGFYSTVCEVNHNDKDFGFSVRCLRE